MFDFPHTIYYRIELIHNSIKKTATISLGLCNSVRVENAKMFLDKKLQPIPINV